MNDNVYFMVTDVHRRQKFKMFMQTSYWVNFRVGFVIRIVGLKIKLVKRKTLNYRCKALAIIVYFLIK